MGGNGTAQVWIGLRICIREILRHLEIMTAFHFAGSDGFKIEGTNLDKLKMWATTYNLWARNQFSFKFEGYNSTFTSQD